MLTSRYNNTVNIGVNKAIRYKAVGDRRAHAVPGKHSL